MLSSQFTADDASEVAERVSFRVDDAVFRHLTRYVGRVKLLSHLHTQYRCIGKGATLDASHPVFVSHFSESIKRAIQISRRLIGAGLGLVTIDPDFKELVNKSSAREPMAFLSIGCTPSFPAPVGYPDGAGGFFKVTVTVRHMIKKLSLVRSPFGAAGGTPDYLPGIAALIQQLMLLPAICMQVPWALSSISQQGYVFVGEERLRDIVDHHLPEVVEQLAPWTPDFAWPADFIQWREWPLSSGNVLRRFRDNFLIDTTSASHALLHRLELARSPLIGNLRAREFELQCQELIDSTSWEPPSEIKALRGRPLRVGGRVLTDIDAIGVKERTLLIVSCKSIIYDRDYDQGVFQVIRNTQATIDGAVKAWDEIVAILRRQPMGANFDFSQFDEIIGVVCTPFTAYSSEGRTLAFVKPNLRMSSSILEIRDWLTGNSAQES